MFPRPAMKKPVVLYTANAMLFALTSTMLMAALGIFIIKAAKLDKRSKRDPRDPRVIASKTQLEDLKARWELSRERKLPSDLRKYAENYLEKLQGIEIKDFVRRWEAGQMEAKNRFEATFFTFTRTDAKSDELQPATKQIEKITKETSR